MSERSKLKRTIGLPHLIGIEVGQTIGAGIFALTGIALAYTGPSLPIGFIVAAVPVGVAMSVLAMLGSVMPISGGTYVYGSRLFSPVAAFTGVWAYILGALLGMFPLYALTGADFLRSVFPQIPRVPAAIVLLSVFYLSNLFGVKLAMWIQAGCVLIMFAALAVFVTVGMGSVSFANWTPLFQGKLGGFAVASSILTFTLMGSNAAVELGDEIKNPEKAIPRSFAITIPLVLIWYVLMALVAVSAYVQSPAPETGMSFLAGRILQGPLFDFFIIGGGFLAIITTLNATFLWGTKSLIVIAEDGLLPMGLAKVNSRFGTPHFLLTAVFGISVLSLLAFERRTETFAVFASLGGIIILIPVMAAALNIKRRLPDLYRNAQFTLKGWYYTAAPILGIVLSIVIVLILLTDLVSHEQGLMFLSIFVFWCSGGAAYAWWRRKHLPTP